MTQEVKRKVGRRAKSKEEKAKTISLTVHTEVKDAIKSIKRLRKFNSSKFFAEKIMEEMERQS